MYTTRIITICLFIVSILLIIHHIESIDTINTGNNSYVKILDIEELKSNLEIYENDYAIIFHSPWCTQCKQLLVYYELMAENLVTRGNNVLMRSFDCENDFTSEGIFIVILMKLFHYLIIFVRTRIQFIYFIIYNTMFYFIQ